MTYHASNSRAIGWTVLVVDDEAKIRSQLSRALAQAIPGLWVLTATNGKEALEILAHSGVNLIVCDQRMPEMDGIEFLTLAAKSAPHVPRILLTGFADMETTVRAVNDGRINAFFEKPVSNEDVTRTALCLLERQADENKRRMPIAGRDPDARIPGRPYTGRLGGEGT